MLAVVLALIVYGSLYPFAFHSGPTAILAWVWAPGLAGVRDTVVNLAVYFPLGMLVYRAAGGGGRGIFGAAVVSLIVSGSLEFLQAFDQSRVSSTLDVVCNLAGGLFGACSARLLAPHIPRERYAAFALVVLAVVARTFPFFPVLHPHWSPLVPEQVVFAALDWLVVRCALSIFLNRAAVNLEFSLLVLVTQSRLFILDQRMSLSDLAGGILALAIGYVWSNPRPGQLGIAMLVSAIARELMPLHFSATPQMFNWIPFATIVSSGSGGSIIFLNKLLIYGSLLWVLDPRSQRIWKIAPPIAILIAVLEWIQHYLPGRTPDITESCIVLTAACGLAALRTATS
jgi:glycopeptide antibiotics resistance protein